MSKKTKRINPRLPNPTCSPVQTRAKKMSSKGGKAAGETKEDPETKTESVDAFQLPPPTKDSEETARKRTEKEQAVGGEQRKIEDQEYSVSPGEVEARLKYLTALKEIQAKEEEIVGLQRRLAAERTRVVRNADIKPTKFSGTADLEDYLSQFSSIAQFNGWSEEQKVVILLSKLEGEALAVAAVLENPTWTQLIAHLRETFSSERQELASLKLQNRLQQSNETLDHLALDIQKLVKKAYSSADEMTKSRLSKDSFIQAIADANTREKLRDKNLATMAECLSEAKRIQANLEIEKNRTKTFVSPQTNVRQVKKEDDERISRLEEEFQRLKNSKTKKTTSNAQPRRSRFIQNKKRNVPVCYNCTMEGHTEKYCPFDEETVSKWIQQGIIQVPKNRRPDAEVTPRQPKTAFPKASLNSIKPPENLLGKTGYGPPNSQ